jgi:hypothetical protein
MRSGSWRLVAGLCIAVLAAGAGCNDRCISCDPVAPSPPQEQPCSFAVAPLAQHFPYRGGGGNVVVTARSECPWTAASQLTWVVITSSGNGGVSYVVQENAGAARSGSIAVAGQAVTITQDGAPAAPPQPPQPPQPSPPAPTPPPASCSFAVQESPQHFTYQGGNGGFSVSASRADCAWSATPQVAWIAVTGGSPGSGNGTVSYLVAGNGGAARTGTISVAGKTVTVTQGAKP